MAAWWIRLVCADIGSEVAENVRNWLQSEISCWLCFDEGIYLYCYVGVCPILCVRVFHGSEKEGRHFNMSLGRALEMGNKGNKRKLRALGSDHGSVLDFKGLLNTLLLNKIDLLVDITLHVYFCGLTSWGAQTSHTENWNIVELAYVHRTKSGAETMVRATPNPDLW